MNTSPESLGRGTDDDRVIAAADTLRRLALDEDLKSRVATDPTFGALA